MWTLNGTQSVPLVMHVMAGLSNRKSQLKGSSYIGNDLKKSNKIPIFEKDSNNKSLVSQI